MSAIPPIATFDAEDERTIEADYDLGSIDPSTNLAAMDWQEFELSEIILEEFSQNEGRVEVTCK